MKLFLAFIFIISCFAQKSWAQETTPIRTRKISQDLNYSYSYVLDLKAGNTMRIDVYDRYGRPLKLNIDSLIAIAVDSYDLISDSLENDYYARTMDVNLYDTVLRSVGWGYTPPDQKRILVYDSTKSIVKFLQDTVVIRMYGMVPSFKEDVPPFLKITLCLNNIRKLHTLQNKKYNPIFNALDPYSRGDWKYGNNGFSYWKANPDVQVLRSYEQNFDQVKLKCALSMSVQNYKTTFVPSLNAQIIYAYERHFIRKEMILGSEQHFTFPPDMNGRSTIQVNGFITFSYTATNLITTKKPGSTMARHLSIGYLIRRQGTVFEKHTFKLQIGQVGITNSGLTIDPTFYFHHFLKGISPGFRVTQLF